MSGAPFRPREVLSLKQKLFHSIHKHTYLKGPYDKITSVAIPLALAGSSLFLIIFLLYFLAVQKRLYWVEARISAVVSDGDWSYISCKKCRRKLEDSPRGYIVKRVI